MAGDDDLVIHTELVGGVGKYGRLLGWLYIGTDDLSLNEQMIEEGYAHPYDGGTKDMNLEALREIHGLMEPLLNKFRTQTLPQVSLQSPSEQQNTF